jgi:hypothetical protein
VAGKSSDGFLLKCLRDGDGLRAGAIGKTFPEGTQVVATKKFECCWNVLQLCWALNLAEEDGRELPDGLLVLGCWVVVRFLRGDEVAEFEWQL